MTDSTLSQIARKMAEQFHPHDQFCNEQEGCVCEQVVKDFREHLESKFGEFGLLALQKAEQRLPSRSTAINDPYQRGWNDCIEVINNIFSDLRKEAGQ